MRSYKCCAFSRQRKMDYNFALRHFDIRLIDNLNCLLTTSIKEMVPECNKLEYTIFTY